MREEDDEPLLLRVKRRHLDENGEGGGGVPATMNSNARHERWTSRRIMKQRPAGLRRGGRAIHRGNDRKMWVQQCLSGGKYC